MFLSLVDWFLMSFHYFITVTDKFIIIIITYSITPKKDNVFVYTPANVIE